ncbi:LysR family transcriptional regulator ArgP [Kribbella deserti]|uniref:LysR family transcriptional regulator ArgP n=1 Tax=Kribbella deserti TaxID=1926257 RepID=A0ABV6QL07_9ACTN
MQIDSGQLATFAAIIEEGSFEAAARRLNVTPGAISQRMKGLESRIGQVLVRRTKPCTATDAGQALIRLARQVSLLETEALAAVRGTAVGERVPIAVNADSLAGWFMPALSAMPAELTVYFDLRAEDQDHSAELLRDGTVLAAVTADPQAVQGCRVQRLGKMRYHAVAAPAYVERWLAGRPPAEALAEAPMIVFNRKDQLQHRFLRTVSRRRLEPPAHYVPSTGPYIEAIRAGLGWGMAEDYYLTDGRLVKLEGGRPVDVPLYWQHWKLESRVLDALTAAVHEAAAKGLR